MKINIDYVANLAKLKLTDDQKEKFTHQLENMLEHFQRIEKVDVNGVEPMLHGVDVENHFREDEVGKSVPRDELLKNAPVHNQESFQVDNILA